MSSERKILVADDSPMVVAMVSRMLRGAGYTVITASNGVEAVQSAYRDAPDLIVLDIFMPRMNGYQACRLLKADPAVAAIPVIILTGSESQGDEFWSLQTGADAFMTKNLDPSALLATVERLLPPAGNTRAAAEAPTAEDILSQVSTLMDRELYSTTVERIELKTILQNLSEGILTCDTEGSIRTVNGAFCRLVDVTEEEIAGKPAAQVLGDPAGPDMQAVLAEALSAQRVVSGKDSEVVRRDGSSTPVTISVAPLRDYLDQTVGCVCLIQDITRRKEIESLAKLKDDLTHMIVHDLRTPLTALTGSLQTLDVLGPLNEDQQEFLKMATSGGEMLLRMINDLLDISKLEDGSMKLEYSDFDPHETLSVALRQVAQLAKDKELDLRMELPHEVPPIRADEEKVRRMLVNLVGNAIKFTPSSGRITISARVLPEEGEVLFAVTDTGEGIPKDAYERIFQKFGQVENRRGGRKNSSGLGLTFCKMVAEAHGGRIWVESELGAGSTFSFTLPLLNSSARSSGPDV
ncbi:MAG: ATP-binding protein [Armatimonadota bacterium]